jgi:membrane associated rhomboid family serine protease
LPAVIPIGDVIPSRTRPWITLLLMGACPVALLDLPWYAAVTLVMIWIHGRTLEDRLGHGRFLLFVAICGAAGHAAQLALPPWGSPVATAGGAAVAGLLGAYFALFPYSRVLLLVPLYPVYFDAVEAPTIILAPFWVLMALLTGISAIPLAAGGVTGAAAVWLFRRPERQRVEWWSEPAAEDRGRKPEA